jgi:hypothetical protein
MPWMTIDLLNHKHGPTHSIPVILLHNCIHCYLLQSHMSRQTDGNSIMINVKLITQPLETTTWFAIPVYLPRTYSGHTRQNSSAECQHLSDVAIPHLREPVEYLLIFVAGNNPVVPKLIMGNQRVEKHKWELTNLNVTITNVAVVTKISSVVLLQNKYSHFTPCSYDY